MCNSRSMLMNFHFLSTLNWKSLLWPQKSNSLTTTLHVHYAFISVSLLSLHDYDMNFNTEKFANIWWFERDGISVIKFKAALMYFLSGVIVAVAVVVAYSSLFFEWGRERAVRLHHVVYKVWLVSYLFFLFQLWYSCTVYMQKGMNIGQSKHYESYTFQPLMSFWQQLIADVDPPMKVYCKNE